MNATIAKHAKRDRRRGRIRAKIKGTAERPRLAVFRSNRFLYAQLIDDQSGTTLAAANSQNDKAPSALERAKNIGVAIAKQADTKKITEAVFDRGGFMFTGNIKALAESAREKGLKF